MKMGEETDDLETLDFKADTTELLALIVNTFYSEKEIFLRELLSNASDALDKMRYEYLTKPARPEFEVELDIKIIPNKAERTLAIVDSGIGMTREDLIEKLGTIARSGTKVFMDAIRNGSDAGWAGSDLSLIGKFGVGFYAAYLVAERVEVSSSQTGCEQHVWESAAGEGVFTVRREQRKRHGRGTTVLLRLKQEQAHFLEPSTIETAVNKHCQFIRYPIKLLTEEESHQEAKSDDGRCRVWKELNETGPIWVRNPRDITSDEYEKFYKSLTNDSDEHLAVKHFSLEGQLQFKALLFVPRKAPSDLFNYNKKKINIKVYVKKVFITDNCEMIIPDYLDFICGIVDSDDLPLNVSREMLQENSVFKVIRKYLIKKCIELFDELSEDKEKYEIFYQEFGRNIKMGFEEDFDNRQKLADYLRFETSLSLGELCSLRDYVGRMKRNQKYIYYMAGEKSEVKTSPYVESVEMHGFEVVYMTEPSDEYVLDFIGKTYCGKKMISVTTDDLHLPEDEGSGNKKETNEERYGNLCKFIKNILGKKIERVVVSYRLVDLPCCIVKSNWGWTGNMQRVMNTESFKDRSTDGFMRAKKSLEVNPGHPIVKKLRELVEIDKNDRSIVDLVLLLFETAVLISGFPLDDAELHASRIYRMLELGLCPSEGPNEAGDAPAIDHITQDYTHDLRRMEQID